MDVRIPNKKIFQTWSELDLLTGVIFGEARGEDWNAKVGVGLTIRTRAEHPGHWGWGLNYRAIILRPKQFSCFNQGDPNLMKIIEADRASTVWQECRMVAEAIYLGRIVDFVGGPTHYHSASMKRLPRWAKKIKRIGRFGGLIFYTCF